jgi:hypothetical protein
MKELINLLDQQEENLYLLLEIITDYQKALIGGDLPNMELLLNSEQKTLSSIQTNLEFQQNVIKDISQKLSLNLSQCSLGRLIEALPSDIKELGRLKKVMNSLKDLAGIITEKNNLNSILINHSRNFIKEIITSIIRNNKKLLDRKI